MLKLIDSLFSLNTKKYKDAHVDAKFIYNFYEENETVTDDEKILVSDFSYRKKRFIRLTFDYEGLNGPDRVDYDYYNYLQNIEKISLKENLSTQDLKIFNKLDKLSSKRKFIINNLDEKEKNQITSFYDQEIHSSASRTLQYSYRMSYLKPEVFNVNINEMNSFAYFPERGMAEADAEYNDLILANQSNIQNIQDSRENFEVDTRGCNFSKLNPFETSVNEISLYKNDYAKYNAIRCGLLVEKFVLENDVYRFLSGKFFTSKRSDDELVINSTIEDEAVKYGQTYKYVAYDVYLYAELDPNDKCVLNKYLICDHPYITKEISCFEEEPPPPPVNIRFRVIDDFNLEISWEEPSDYQYDAKGYQILKRHNLDEPFKVIKQLEGHLNTDLYLPEENIFENLIERTPGKVKYRYIDSDYKKGKISIYSIRTIDAHGFFSKYSDQIAILYDPFEDKLIYDLVSVSGANRNFPNEKVLNKTLFFDYDDKIIDNLPVIRNIKNISLYATPDFAEIRTSEGSNFKILNNDETFKFTIFRLNDLKKYEKQFKITNFSW